MRAVRLTAAMMLALFLAGGCQKIEYKVVSDLPAPVFADEQVAPLPPANPVGPVVAGNVPAKDPNYKPVPNAGNDALAGRNRLGVPEALLADWETHSHDNGWRYIVIHHSATTHGNAAEFDKEHRGRGWDELGYHFVIGNGVGSRDGLVEVGPRWRTQKHGAHCKTNDERFNDFGIGICLVGNFETERPTAAQMASLRTLVSYLADRYHVPVSNILGHGEAVALMHEGRGTKCPGRNFDMDAFRQAIRTSRLASVRP